MRKRVREKLKNNRQKTTTIEVNYGKVKKKFTVNYSVELLL